MSEKKNTDSYYDYLNNTVPAELENIYNQSIIQEDKKNAAALEHINSAYGSNLTYAENVKNTAINNATTQKEAATTYADSILKDTLGFNQSQYDELLKSINQSKNTGTALAEQTRKLLLGLSSETRNMIYQAAEAARLREYEQADIARERGIVDAANAYEQNKATYGANAEEMAAMGLTGGGYSDYLNAQAYATQRGEVQYANATAENAKRAARYAEEEKKLNADLDYAKNVKEAELKYSEDVSKVTETYEKALSEAGLWKSEADYKANTQYKSDKYAADQEYNRAVAEAETTYASSLAQLEQAKEQAIYEANRATEDAKYEANLKLEEGKLTNEQAVEKYKHEMYLYFLEQANQGTYTADVLEAIAKEIGLGEPETESLLAAIPPEKDETEMLNATSAENYQKILSDIKELGADYYTESELDKMVDQKLLTEEDKEALKSYMEETKTALETEEKKNISNKIDYYLTKKDYSSLASYVDEMYATKAIDKDTYQNAYFEAALGNCKSATGDDEMETVTEDIDKLLEEEKLSEKDANSLKQYLYAKNGYYRVESGYSVELGYNFWQGGNYAIVSVDGEEYKLRIDSSTSSSEKEMINVVLGGAVPKSNSLVVLDGRVFIYSDGKWWRSKATSKDPTKRLKNKAKITAPTHNLSSEEPKTANSDVKKPKNNTSMNIN